MIIKVFTQRRGDCNLHDKYIKILLKIILGFPNGIRDW